MTNSLVNIGIIGSFPCLHLLLLTGIIALALFLFEPPQNCSTYGLVLTQNNLTVDVSKKGLISWTK